MIQEKLEFAWWDALIVAAAQVTSCSHLLSEDFQDGQDLDGVIVLNPFRHKPAESPFGPHA